MVGNDIACDILIRHFRRLGLSVDALNDEGFTALVMAAKHGHITCAQILLGQGKASIKHRDIKYGLSVEEWLAKKGFSLQDIAPIRHDGKGRSRFVKLANIAAICSGPKRSLQQNSLYGDIDYNLNNFQLNKYEDDEEQYMTDGTANTDLSIPRYIARYHDLDLDFGSKHYRVYPYQQRPKLKTQGTQTDVDDETNNKVMTATENRRNLPNDQMTDITTVTDTAAMLDQRQRIENKLSPDRKGKGSRSSDKAADNKGKDPVSPNKRLSLPGIDETPMVSRSEGGPSKKGERKKSLDVLPEKLIASIDLGDGRRHSIQLHPDSTRNKVYWTPVTQDDDSDEVNDKNSLMPRQFDKQRVSISDSETSTNEDGPIFS